MSSTISGIKQVGLASSLKLKNWGCMKRSAEITGEERKERGGDFTFQHGKN
jgi:hypothetical protein